jgi:hypothetical protein
MHLSFKELLKYLFPLKSMTSLFKIKYFSSFKDTDINNINKKGPKTNSCN